MKILKRYSDYLDNNLMTSLSATLQVAAWLCLCLASSLFLTIILK